MITIPLSYHKKYLDGQTNTKRRIRARKTRSFNVRSIGSLIETKANQVRYGYIAV